MPAAVTTFQVPTVPDPHTPPPVEEEVHDGVAAGHGTFIVNLLAQLLPQATIYAASTGLRYDDDDHLGLDTEQGTTAVMRDDSTVAAALNALAVNVGDDGLDYLNLSFGTYGCTGLLETPVESAAEIPVYMTPLGLRTVLENWAAANPEMQVFAASGNDSHDASVDPEIFFPAGWAVEPDHEWLHSVASDPLNVDVSNPDDDYSNRGWWVELQAKEHASRQSPPRNMHGSGGLVFVERHELRHAVRPRRPRGPGR